MTKSTMFIALDTAKDFHDVALAEEGRSGEVRHYGTIDSSLSSLDKLVRKLSAPGRTLHFVYEAGPCGYTTRSPSHPEGPLVCRHCSI